MVRKVSATAPLLCFPLQAPCRSVSGIEPSNRRPSSDCDCIHSRSPDNPSIGPERRGSSPSKVRTSPAQHRRLRRVTRCATRCLKRRLPDYGGWRWHGDNLPDRKSPAPPVWLFFQTLVGSRLLTLAKRTRFYPRRKAGFGPQQTLVENRCGALISSSVTSAETRRAMSRWLV